MAPSKIVLENRLQELAEDPEIEDGLRIEKARVLLKMLYPQKAKDFDSDDVIVTFLTAISGGDALVEDEEDDFEEDEEDDFFEYDLDDEEDDFEFDGEDGG